LVDALELLAPQFHAALLRELDVIGHRGPAEVEMRSSVYADEPERLARMVASALGWRDGPQSRPPTFPAVLRPIAHYGAGQLRDREERRDRMVRAIWVLRNMLREYGARLVSTGSLDTVDDVFYLTVDELDAPPPDLMALVRRRREQQRRLAELVPPEAFSGSWRSSGTSHPPLAAGEVLQGLGVCHGQARGRVRIVSSESVDEVRPGEVLVAKVVDVGYTPAFAFSAAVVTELGGPLSHAAIVAREFAVPCVVNARDATGRLTPGALVQVDGSTGQITVLD
jgi:phosphohistidine swiveling domain-containing protein